MRPSDQGMQYVRYIVMPFILLFTTIINASAYYCQFDKPASSSIEGRWDITVDVDGKKFPSWLEVRHSGLHMLVGQFVGIGGSARPVSRINFTDGKMSFS